MGWVDFAKKAFTLPINQSDLPWSVWLVGLLHATVSASVIGIVVFNRAFHRRHWRAMNAGMLVAVLTTYQPVRVMLLWMRFVDARTASHLWLEQLQRFSVENPYATTAWLLMIGLSIGQIPDLLLTTLFLIRDMFSNKAICGCAQWGPAPPALVGAARVGSVCLSEVGGPFLGGHGLSAEFSCPAALAFWQVVGWWVSCVIVFFGDILLRRAFLHTREARMFLGPAYEAAASRWPLGSSAKMQTCGRVLLILCFSACLIWNTALPLLS